MIKGILALSITLALVGCGSSSDDSDKSGNTPSGSNLADKMAEVVLQDIGTTGYCAPDSPTFATTDLNVAYMAGANQTNIEDLKNAARLSQVGLDELISKTGLDKSGAELNITSNNKWTVCYDDNQTGNGTGSIRQLNFSPEDFSDDGYILAKHELFHVFQSALLKESEAYNHLPFWFQEASADYFAGQTNVDEVNAGKLTLFTENANATPFSVTTYQIAQALKPIVGSDLYRIYHKSLQYLISRGLTNDQILTLTRESYSQSFDATRANFDTSMASLTFTDPLPVTFIELRDDVDYYDTHVIKNWLWEEEYTANFTTVGLGIEIGSLYFVNTLDNEGYSGTVKQGQILYGYAKGTLPDGDYDVYASNIPDTESYGPIQQSVTNGVLGDLDFTGQALCSTCDD